MQLKPIWLVALLLSSGATLAQKKESFNFVRMGLHATDQNYNLVGGTGVPMAKPGFSFGMGRNIEIGQHLRLQPGLEYTPRGYRSRRTLSDSTYYRSWNGLHYLDFTLTLSLLAGRGYTKLYVDAAPYVAYGIYGRNKITRRIPRRTFVDSTQTFRTDLVTDVENRNPFRRELKRFDYGYRVSIGLKRESTTFGITYSEGLANLDRQERYFTRNRTLGLFLTYVFDDMF